MDVQQIQNELGEIATVSLLISKRIEQAQGCLGLGDISARTELELATEACNRVKSRLEAVRIGMWNGTS